MTTSFSPRESLRDESDSDSREKELATILVVDDSSVDRRFVGMFVRKTRDCRVVYAENGREALEMVVKESPTTILTDLQMPEIDGLQLVKAIREQYPRIPVILMTAHGSHRLAFEALKAGAFHYVSKTAIAKELPKTLDQALKMVEKSRRRHRLLGCLLGQDSRFCIENDPSLVAALLDHYSEQLQDLNFGDATTRMRVSVALQEALANALFHGNLEVSSDLRQEDERVFFQLAEERRTLFPYRDRRIFIHSRFEKESILFTIRDEGNGYDVSKSNEEFDPDDMLRVGGRGLLLIRTFMDEVTHNPKGNVITMVKYGAGHRAR